MAITARDLVICATPRAMWAWFGSRGCNDAAANHRLLAASMPAFGLAVETFVRGGGIGAVVLRDGTWAYYASSTDVGATHFCANRRGAVVQFAPPWRVTGAMGSAAGDVARAWLRLAYATTNTTSDDGT